MDLSFNQITSMKLAASEQEIAGASRIEEYSNIVSEKDALDEQLKQLQVDLSLAHSTIAEQVHLQPFICVLLLMCPCISFLSGALEEYKNTKFSHITLTIFYAIWRCISFHSYDISSDIIVCLTVNYMLYYPQIVLKYSDHLDRRIFRWHDERDWVMKLSYC